MVLAATPLHAQSQRRVVLYSQPGCPPCAALKSDFQRAGITPEVYDITTDATRAREFSALGGSGTPLMWVQTGTDAAGNPVGTTFAGRSATQVDLARTPLPATVAPPTTAIPAPQPNPAESTLQQAVPPPPATQQAARELLDRSFRRSLTFQDLLKNLSQRIAQSLSQLSQALGTVPGAGQVSRFKTPNPTYLGYGRPGGYRPPGSLGQASRYKTPKPPAPITDTPRLGTPGGGKPGDPFWARNCLCHASTGARAGVAYEVTNICPLDFLPCEVSMCGPIVRHDNFVSTIDECLRHSDAAHRPFGF